MLKHVETVILKQVLSGDLMRVLMKERRKSIRIP